jgi:hypothetical protein
MKNKFIFSLIAVLVFATVSCTKNTTTSIVRDGKWKITLYNDSGNDETNHYTGYEFTFGKDGNVTAVKGSASVTGTFSTTDDDSQHKLVLNFGADPVFSELNDDWHIVEETSTKIRLEDVSGGGSGTDLLTFEKL